MMDIDNSKRKSGTSGRTRTATPLRASDFDVNLITFV